jgi:hypothetical protein
MEMKRYIIITSEGSTKAPNTDYEINNKQVIGIVENVNSEEEAIRKLVVENDWIIDAEFNVGEFIVYQIL